MTGEISRLKVGDEGFLVASMIDRCPKSMMLRELVRNAVEAAQTAPEGERRVVVEAVVVDGVRKLSIRNTGRGMDADELYRMCDIASSIRKQNSLEQNFGMGAKVASLPSNRFGLRYRSCRLGRVCEVVLGWRDGVYGRLRRGRPGLEGLHEVLDVTAEALAEGARLEQDWTEVLLLGNRAEQDTAAEPYDGAPPMVPYWVAEELHKRFFRLPADVELILAEGLDRNNAAHRFETIWQRMGRHYTRHETVAAEDGCLIHYLFDAYAPGGPGAADDRRTVAAQGVPYFVHGMAGLVFRDEIYDLQWHQQWLHLGPVFGIPFCGRNVSVFVELPDHHPVLPDGYRQFLRRRDGLGEQLFLRQFATAVAALRPGWLVELIERSAPDSAVSGDVSEALRRLLRELRVPRRARAGPARDVAAPAPGATAGEEPDEAPSPDEPPAELRPEALPEPAAEASGDPPPPAPPGAFERDDETADEDAYEPPPQIILMRDEAEIGARGLAERGGRYYPETHQLFVNCLYPAVASMRGLLEEEFAADGDADAVRLAAARLAERSLVERVGRMLVFALAKQGRWADWEMEHALSAPALSLAADDIHQSLPAARAALRAELRLRQLAHALA